MNEPRFYTCKFCYKEYVPTRRGAQKYCSDTCRSKAYHHRKLRKNGLEKKGTLPDKYAADKKPPGKQSVDKMSLAGVGNATMGTLAADAFKSILTKYENKAATKKDIMELKSVLSGARYYPVKNMIRDSLGRAPHYDMETGNVVYLLV
ncbi:hypothetical protein ABI125_05210 [Tamlana crocina]